MAKGELPAGHPARPDPNTMTRDELFHTLGLDDMNDAERTEFLRAMNAWSRYALPGPNRWWIWALIQANLWRKTNERHVDELIADALGEP